MNEAPTTTTDAGPPSGHSTVDTTRIRELCEAVLWGGWPAEDEQRLAAGLLADIHLLLGVVAERAHHMSDTWRHTAEHVLARTRDMLAHSTEAQGNAWRLVDLATQCRALTVLADVR